MDGRFSHNHSYYNHGYTVHEPPGGGGRPISGPNGTRYWFHGGNWYRWNGGAWVVWGAPIGLFVPFLPPYFTTVWWYGVPYYYANDTYYLWDDDQQQYEVVAPPDGIEAGGTTQPPMTGQLFIYPRNGQSQQQQATDRAECERWALNQIGLNAPPAGGVAASVPPEKRSDFFRAEATCLEGRGYSVD
jgi:hypothetical protein